MNNRLPPRDEREFIGSRSDRARGGLKLPMHLILFLVAQTISGACCLAEVVFMVHDHERRILNVEAFENKTDGDGKVIAERLGRLEERSATSQQSLQHIEAMLEQSAYRMPK